MIKNTFSILHGIGEKLETRLWSEGILTWEDFVSETEIPFISPERKTQFNGLLGNSIEELSAGNALFFSKTVSGNEHWRLFEKFSGEAVCLDIETNGYAPGRGGYATVVGLYDGKEYKSLIRGINLTPDTLEEAISGYKYLITFFGTVFDIPFLRQMYRAVDLSMPHFDLCFGAKRVGLKGGLKKIEPQLGIQRPADVSGITSYDAVILWNQYKYGDKKALEMLVEYNREDTVNLMNIADIIYKRLKESTGIDKYLNGHK